MRVRLDNTTTPVRADCQTICSGVHPTYLPPHFPKQLSHDKPQDDHGFPAKSTQLATLLPTDRRTYPPPPTNSPIIIPLRTYS